jgi:hypothetical protein
MSEVPLQRLCGTGVALPDRVCKARGGQSGDTIPFVKSLRSSYTGLYLQPRVG